MVPATGLCEEDGGRLAHDPSLLRARISGPLREGKDTAVSDAVVK